MQERQRSWSVVEAWTSCRVQASFHVLSIALEWAATASSAMGAQEMQWAQTLEGGPWLQVYTVPGNGTPLEWQTTEGGPVRSDKLEVVVSFCYLGDMSLISSQWLWTFNHNICEPPLDEVQGAAASSFFPPLLIQDKWPLVQLLCEESNAPCKWDLAIDKAKPPTSAAVWQGNDQMDLHCQAARHCHYRVQWAACLAWHWGPGPHLEGEKAPLVWTGGTVQRCNQVSLWHTGWWKVWSWVAQDDIEAADREGSRRVEALGYRLS